jgi:hypothetical protein
MYGMKGPKMYKTEKKAPKPATDWITASELARMLGVSAKTARLRARAGELDHFRHGVAGCGRKKYSRTLVRRTIDSRWEEAIRRQDCAEVEN